MICPPPPPPPGLCLRQIRPFTAARVLLSRQRPSNSPTLRPSIRPVRRKTRWRSSTATKTPRHMAKWSAVRATDGRQRTAPLRLERLLECPVSRRAPPIMRSCGAALPGRPRDPLVEHLRPRHPARSAKPRGVTHHPGRRTGRQGGVLPPAHRALRPWRHLHVRVGRRQRRRRTRRCGAARSRHVRGDRAVGIRTTVRSFSPTTSGGICTTTR